MIMPKIKIFSRKWAICDNRDIGSTPSTDGGVKGCMYLLRNVWSTHVLRQLNFEYLVSGTVRQ